LVVDEEGGAITLVSLVVSAAAITCQVSTFSGWLKCYAPLLFANKTLIFTLLFVQKFIPLCQAKIILKRNLEERSAVVIQAHWREALVRSNSFIVNQTQLYRYCRKRKCYSDESMASHASTGNDIVGIFDPLEEENPEDRAAPKIQGAWRRSWAQF
jgi:hypothetical protein